MIWEQLISLHYYSIFLKIDLVINHISDKIM